ncbi:TonB-dependent receptor family protein [Chitinophaga pendula]|uniref:TonB-dependent receptor n=1 Tax=Chitinophaga TaxID=79328 RepID=UPI000BB01916|nr:MULTISPECIES: TonB-dependent receptor [Chitinophaga]ASZ12674.1 hypothetical protein CK934_17775 [Chitinophaga sp. MD30]UCJ09716.1 TonB-dependent receptor family protein [Chitinophaga pendula]
MRLYFLFLCLIGCPLGLLAQQRYAIKGAVTDTAGTAVESATITILKAADSSLVSFTLTTASGKFRIPHLPAGNYRLLITHVNYKAVSRPLRITGEIPEDDIGNIRMSTFSRTLADVIITAEAPPVTLNGDTVQYNAGSFKVPPNSSVEQLLKKLPGIEVAKDGSVTTQGKKVEKILVDGKEFFGKDTRIATQNLAADMLDKVQVYDKKSEQAMMTGMDDGNGEKTINLQLKKDKRKGLFGQIAAGAGTDQRYTGKAGVHSFKESRQLSLLGWTNNVNQRGFSEPYAAQKDPRASAGYTTTTAVGTNYNKDLSDKSSISLNYFGGRDRILNNTDRRRKYILQDSTYEYNEHATTDTTADVHRFNIVFEHAIDSFQSFKINPSLNYEHQQGRSNVNYAQSDIKGTNTSGGTNNTSLTGDNFDFNNSMVYRKKLRAPGHSFLVLINNAVTSNNANRLLSSIRSNATDSLRQSGKDRITNYSHTAKVFYTFPVWKRTLLQWNAAATISGNRTNSNTFDFNKNTGQYDIVNDRQTNLYSNNIQQWQAGAKWLSRIGKNINYAIGADLLFTGMQGNTHISGAPQSLDRRYTNLLPNLFFKYAITRSQQLTATYTTSTQLPDVSQLQPVPDLRHLPEIRIGNPSLQQAYQHVFQLHYLETMGYSGRSLFAGLVFSGIQHKIATTDSLTANGERYIRPVNVKGTFSLNGHVQLSFPVQWLQSKIRVGGNAGYNQDQSFVNGIENRTRTLYAAPTVYIDLAPTSKIDITLGAAYGFNYARYTAPKITNTTFSTQQYDLQVDWALFAGLHLNTSLYYVINRQQERSFNTNIPLWHAAISHSLLKNKRGELRLTIRDILKSNVVIYRNITPAYIEDNSAQALSRYGLLTFTYKLGRVLQ